VHWLGESAGWVGLDRNLQPFRGLDSVVSLDLLVAKIKFSVVYLLSGVAQYSLAYSATTIVGPSFFAMGWVSQVMVCVGLDQRKWTDERLCCERDYAKRLQAIFTKPYRVTDDCHGKNPLKFVLDLTQNGRTAAILGFPL